MIIPHNVQIIENLPFEEYLEIKNRVSHSRAKNKDKPFKETPKIRLGSQVDNFINEPSRFDSEDINFPVIKSLARALLEYFGFEVYYQLKKQVSIFADFEFKGMLMPYMGRIDDMYERLIVDIKVSLNLKGSCEYFGYQDAMNGYCIPTKINDWLLISVHPNKIDLKTGMNKIETLPAPRDPETQVPLKIDHSFWEKQVMKSSLSKPIRKYV